MSRFIKKKISVLIPVKDLSGKSLGGENLLEGFIMLRAAKKEQTISGGLIEKFQIHSMKVIQELNL